MSEQAHPERSAWLRCYRCWSQRLEAQVHYDAILRIDPEMERRQVARVAKTRAARDDAAVEETLAELRRQAATDANLMHPIIECSRARATVGEMVSALQDVFGTYTETPVY